jgi:hypothetical protein
VAIFSPSVKASVAGPRTAEPTGARVPQATGEQISKLRAQFRSARARREFEQMFAAGNELLALDPGIPGVSRAMARTLTELGREGEAKPHWVRTRDQDAGDAEAAYQVARHAMRTGLAPAEAVAEAAPGANELLRQHLIDLVGKPEAPLPPDCRHIGICGVSFCGSTLLDRILGGLPGVRSIGESHWLVKEHDGSKYVPIDLGIKRSGRGPFCSVCGPSCKVLTSEFRTGLIVDATRWYQRIAAQLGTSILVSADKNVAKLVDNDPLLRLSALVVFKSPDQAWASQLAKLPKDREPEFYRAELVKYMGTWTQSYRTFVDEFAPDGAKVFLKFDDFTMNPAPLLEKICAELDLPYDPAVLSEVRPGHAIGGNKGAMARLRAADYGVRVEPLPAAGLISEQAEMIENNKALQDCYRSLMSRYRQTLPLA